MDQAAPVPGPNRGRARTRGGVTAGRASAGGVPEPVVVAEEGDVVDVPPQPHLQPPPDEPDECFEIYHMQKDYRRYYERHYQGAPN
jgi:hypothetical protein